MRMNELRLEIDDLATVIRESMATQNKDDGSDLLAQTISPETNSPQLKLQPEFKLHSTQRYHINDLLRYHDRVFVQAAYRAVLKRSPDEAECLRELKRLRAGDINKIDLLASLRFSREGRGKGVQLDGLFFPALIRRLGQIPLFGYVIRLGIAFVRLPRMIRDQREFGSYVLSQHEQIADFINHVSSSVSECRHEVSRLDESLSRLDQRLSKQIETRVETLAQRQVEFEHIANTQFSVTDRRYDNLEAYAKEQSSELLTQLTTFEKTSNDRQAALISEQREAIAKTERDFRAEISRLYLQLQHARSELTIQATTIHSLSHGTRQLSVEPSGDTHQLDALYAALEDRFRGSRDDIKEGFKIYLPYVKDLAPVLDLGCGRGDWLEILSEQRIEAHGIDNNQIQIEQCRNHGLKVTENDFVAHLRSMDDASVGTITGFHIIEHLSLDTLLTLLNESMRVLRPGGLVIFETPNPENVLVGSNYFYMDPTHRHPLPSELMAFLLETRGFQSIEILNLHPWESAKISGENEVNKRVNDYFYGPMDYAIMGRKVTP